MPIFTAKLEYDTPCNTAGEKMEDQQSDESSVHNKSNTKQKNKVIPGGGGGVTGELRGGGG